MDLERRETAAFGLEPEPREGEEVCYISGLLEDSVDVDVHTIPGPSNTWVDPIKSPYWTGYGAERTLLCTAHVVGDFYVPRDDLKDDWWWNPKERHKAKEGLATKTESEAVWGFGAIG
ncbi:hypothetical protein F4819DRAFT_503766 [Hypoxylon fuscum]|nr:hypothetical protein F4819DRAFT_503766 [Hypoxylon fuscum]